MSDNQNAAPGGLRDTIAANSRKQRNLIIALAVFLVVAIVAVVVIVAQNAAKGDEAAAPGGGERLSVRIATAEDTLWHDEIKKVAAEDGLDVEWVNVDDWVLPNTELVAGNVDGNAFQHILYLSAFNAANDAELTPLFSTVITQWGIFSASLDSLDSLSDGARIAIPDDPSNGGRALFILQAAGLIELADDVSDFPLVEDITANPLNLEFVEVGARTIPQQFDDPSLSAVVVGTSYFDPSQGITNDDALYLDDSTATENLPYTNVVATRADDVDNPAWAILEKAYRDPRVADALEKEYFGATVAVEVPVKTLRSKLADLEALAAKS